ncbi:unnamed protein product [Paramecium octaurelia]|uniref:Uncharacterized protein n=1 Tax=Paramecium octaurelia TaxID=43137 RepID=A0A8S1WXB2_PAROT|nr:unnamed protein product [Paramecium octaurelia]
MTLDIGSKQLGDSLSLLYQRNNFQNQELLKYTIFLKMLQSSMRNQTFYIDILALQDLEQIKIRGLNKINNKPQFQTIKLLILSYIFEFGKVHYLLPLINDTSH